MEKAHLLIRFQGVSCLYVRLSGFGLKKKKKDFTNVMMSAPIRDTSHCSESSQPYMHQPSPLNGGHMT